MACPLTTDPTLTIGLKGNGTVALSWTAVSGANEYIIKYGTATGVYDTEIQLGNVTSHTVTGLTNGTKYFFVVTARFTSYLLRFEFEGDDESQTITDTSEDGVDSPHATTVNNSAQIDTSQFKVGSSSYFSVESTEDNFTMLASDDFLWNNDIIFHTYMRFASGLGVGDQVPIWGQGAPGETQNYINIDLTFPSGGAHNVVFSSRRSLTPDQLTFNYSPKFVVDTWYELKVERVDDDIEVFIDGTSLVSQSINPNSIPLSNSNILKVGDFRGIHHLDGWFDNYYLTDSQCSSNDSNEVNGTPVAFTEEVFCPFVEDGQVRKMVTSITGLDHLEGLVIKVQTDGVLPTDSNGKLVTNAFTVSSGAITLDQKAAVVHAGLAYDGTLQLLKNSDGSIIGTGQTKMRRVYLTVVRFLQGLGLKVGPNSDDLSPIFLDTPELPLFTGDKRKLPFAPWNDETEMVFKMEDPLPCLIQSILLESEVEEK